MEVRAAGPTRPVRLLQIASLVREVTDATIDEERASLQAAIERDEAELHDAAGDLATAVGHELNLRRRVAADPLPWMLGAFVVGVWLGSGK
jgi:hypothetical protein